MQEPERILFLTKDIDEESSSEIIKAIVNINYYDDEKEKEIIEYTRSPIILNICTNGGLIDYAVSIYDLIKTSKTPIWAYASGIVASAGFLILISADKRFSYENTDILYHQASFGLSRRTVKEASRISEHMNATEEKLEKIVLKNTKIRKQDLDFVNERNQDWHMTTQEALELGVIDEIIKNKERKFK